MKKEWIGLLKWPLVSLIVAVVGNLTETQFVESMATLGGIATIVPVIVEWAKVKWNLSGKIWLFKYPAARWLTWGFAFVLVYVSWYFGFGFETMGVLKATIYAIGAGLAANRYFHWEQIELFLSIVYGREDKAEALKEIIELRKKK